MPRRHPLHSMAPCSVQVVVLEKLEYGACSRLDEGHEIEACDQGGTFGNRCRRWMLSTLSIAEVPAAGRRSSTSGDDSSDPLYMSVEYCGPTAQPCTGNRELACAGPFMSMWVSSSPLIP
ncbi:unnamed protein product [Sphagnum troendelagicum]|uniref:Uncharacterized protein n=1 Tax=Sphagnum troendelagicum TaxID=128251 RepID=A0ABP0TPD6_9BRYO